MSHEFNWFDMPDWAKAANQAAERANRMQQEQLAREWAEKFKPLDVNEECRAAVDFILKHTTPPTMEDVEWSDDKHRGMGAVDDVGQEWVMLQDDGDYINCVSPDFNPAGAKRGELTPNGKRYKVVEATVSQGENVADDQPEHPKVLRTKDDFADAPDGTIVAKPGYIAVSKKCGEWVGMHLIRTDSTMAETGPYEVLRWGRGE